MGARRSHGPRPATELNRTELIYLLVSGTPDRGLWAREGLAASTPRQHITSRSVQFSSVQLPAWSACARRLRCPLRGLWARRPGGRALQAWLPFFGTSGEGGPEGNSHGLKNPCSIDCLGGSRFDRILQSFQVKSPPWENKSFKNWAVFR